MATDRDEVNDGREVPGRHSYRPVTMSYGESDEETLCWQGVSVVVCGVIRCPAKDDAHNAEALARFDFAEAAPLRAADFGPLKPGAPADEGRHFMSLVAFGDEATFRVGFVADWFRQFERLLSGVRFRDVRVVLRIDEEGYDEVPELNVFYHCHDDPNLYERRRVDRWVFESLWFPSPGERIDI